jgi:hypothetical protein
LEFVRRNEGCVLVISGAQVQRFHLVTWKLTGDELEKLGICCLAGGWRRGAEDCAESGIGRVFKAVLEWNEKEHAFNCFLWVGLVG